MSEYTSTKASSTVKSNAGSETFTFDVSSAITAASIPAYSKITKVNITVWGDIDTSSSRGKMTASFGSESICSDVWAGGSAGEVSKSKDITISTFFNSENANAGKLKDSSTRLKIILDGPVMLSKFNHTASWRIHIQWRERFTITFDANGGSCSTSSMYVYNLDTYGTLPTPSRTGYTFNGWYTEKSGGVQITSSSQAVHGTTTLYARWTINTYTITTAISPSGSGSVSGSGAYNYGTGVTLTANPSTGYKFIKWNDGNTSNPRSITVSGDITYTAYFEADKINKIYVGTSQPSKIFVGTSEVKAIYIGTTKVYG